MLMLGGLSVTQYPGYTGTTRLLERMADGSVNFHEDQPLSSPNYLISLDGAGQIILTPTTTVSRRYERTFPDVSVVQRISQGHVLRRLARSGGISLWVLKSEWVDLDVGSAGAPPVPVTEYRVLSGTDLDGWVRASAWSFSSLQFSLPWLCIEPGTLLPERMGICGYPLHRFGANGSGYTTEQGMPLTEDGEPMVPWGSTPFGVTIDNGTRLTIDNGQTQTHFWRLQSGTVGRSVVPTVFLSRSLQGTTQGETMVGLTPSLLLQFDVSQPSIIQPLGNWRTGFQQAQAPSYLGPDISVTFSRLADGTSEYSVEGDYGDSVDSLRWSITGFGIYNVRASARYADGSSRQVNGCTPSVIAAGAISCSALVRYFRPITLARGSYYGVEERYQVRYPDPNASPSPGTIRGWASRCARASNASTFSRRWSHPPHRQARHRSLIGPLGARGSSTDPVASLRVSRCSRHVTRRGSNAMMIARHAETSRVGRGGSLVMQACKKTTWMLMRIRIARGGAGIRMNHRCRPAMPASPSPHHRQGRG